MSKEILLSKMYDLTVKASGVASLMEERNIDMFQRRAEVLRRTVGIIEVWIKEVEWEIKNEERYPKSFLTQHKRSL